jgi:hypothetical protein
MVHRLRHRRTRAGLPRADRGEFRIPNRHHRSKDTSSITHAADRPCVPVEIRPDVGATLAANLADEARLDVRQPHVIGPAVRHHLDRVTAFVIRAIDQQTPHTAGAHLAERDFLRAHGAIEARRRRLGKLSIPWGSEAPLLGRTACSLW